MDSKRNHMSFVWFVLVAVLPSLSHAYSGGSGTPGDPYQIATAADLIALGDEPNDYGKYFILTADIDLDPNLPGRKVFDKAVIAPKPYWEGGTPFTGFLDGKGYTISHLTIMSGGYLGLFGQLASGAELRDLGMTDVNIASSGDYVSGLVGYNAGSVSNSYSTGSVTGGNYVGVLVGFNDGSVSNSYSTGSVTGKSCIGGLMGYNWDYVSNSISMCSVSGSENCVGGLVGYNKGCVLSSYNRGSVTGGSDIGGLVGCNREGSVSNSYNTGSVSGMGDDIGGLVGYNRDGSVSNSYSTGSVSDTGDDIGGLVGYNEDGSISRSFWDTSTSGRNISDGGTGLTTAQMQDPNTFLDSGWDFLGERGNGVSEIWQISGGRGYPALSVLNGYIPPLLKGAGTLEDPYVVETAEDLGTVWYRPTACYRLESDVDLSEVVWSTAVVPAFAGRFDGQGHKIRNLTISSGGHLGFFGSLAWDAAVSGLGLEDVNVVGMGQFVGGIVGINSGSVSNSYTKGSVTGGGDIGSLVGYNWAGSVSTSYSTGSVSGTGDHLGGLVGGNGGSVLRSFWDTTTSGRNISDGGAGLTTAQMQDPNTFLDSGWDFLGERGNGVSEIWQKSGSRGYSALSVLKGYIPPLLKGAGTLDDPYVVETPEDLGTVWYRPTACYHLAMDVDLSGVVWSTAVVPTFAGRFDGQGHKIRNLTISSGGHLGLFGSLAWGAAVSGLGLEDVNVVGTGDYIGGLVGINAGSVSNSYTKGSVTGGGDIGGLVGYNQAGSVSNCCNTGSVLGRSAVGGLVGRNWGSVSKSSSTGSVNGTGKDVGGLVGINTDSISNSYSTGSVFGIGDVGGLVGCNRTGSVSNSYSTGSVFGTGDYFGGLVGNNMDSVWNSFWDTTTSGRNTSDGGTGLATSQMQDINTYLDAGWKIYTDGNDFPQDTCWVIAPNHYPRLSWQLYGPQIPEGLASIVLVDVPAGTFQMGDHDCIGESSERPVHTVTLTGFQMSKYEVTNAQYTAHLNAAMAAGQIQVVKGVVYTISDSSRSQPYFDTVTINSYSQIEYNQGQFTVRSRDGKSMADHPVVQVRWYGAKAFCDYYGYRLPTEAEWEYAARGGYHDPYYRYPWGSNTIDCTKANYRYGSNSCNPLNLTSYPYTSPVGYYGAQGAYGLCDMSGNVWEWCQDWYDEDYYSVSPANNPAGPATGTFRIVRGGCWYFFDYYCRVADRVRMIPEARGDLVGFRVCR